MATPTNQSFGVCNVSLATPKVAITKIFRSGHDCTSASSARSPCNFDSQVDIAISVHREVKKMLCLPDSTFVRGCESNS